MTGADPEALRFLEGIQAHVTTQLERITSESGLRADLLQAEIDRRFTSAEKLVTVRHDDLVGLLDERHANQVTAMRTAFEAADKAMAAALAAAEKAVLKAEGASNERFKATNEFRGQLADIIGTFMSRVETETRLTALDEKYDSATGRNTSAITELDHRLTERLNALALQLTSRLDLAGGRDEGQSERRTEHRLDVSQALQGIAVLAAILTLIVLYVTKR